MLKKTRDSSVARAQAAARVLLLAVGALAGCGQKGALFLPGTPPTAAATMDLPPVRDPVPAGAPPLLPASAPLRP